eukprot:TRINITY_DN27167_c0_g1_i1.p1 TRINITY_DN27167_c0_g1~~TRINITY_DN27167_c0_g1_i1.p1  ORF type:complete len:561 (+),score=161.93 TRINITY_DN27167_c0_g1_i1:228-1685(+)
MELFDVSSDRRTEIGDTLSAAVHPRAAQAVHVIERYQKTTKRKLFGLLETDNFREGDVRTYILEDMKAWLCSVTEGSMNAKEIGSRLEYCRQILLRPSIFEPKLRESRDQRSFLQTVGEVCQQLDELLRLALLADQSEAAGLKRIVELGRDIVEAAAAVLLFTLPDERSVLQPLRARAGAGTPGSGGGPPEAIPMRNLLRAFGESAGASTDVERLLGALLSGRHFRELGASDQELLEMSHVSCSQESPASNRLEAARERLLTPWSSDESLKPERSGLSADFCGRSQGATRRAYLDVCGHLDHTAFFLTVLRQYTRLTSIAGEMGANRLHSSLNHLLQELEKALGELRLARLDVMRAVKRRLQELALAGNMSDADRRWAQGLQHVEDSQLDDLQLEVAQALATARAAASADRSAELHASARQGLQDIAAAFQSPDFQARLKVADGYRRTVQLAALADGGAGARPPTTTRPAAIAPGGTRRPALEVD